MQHRVHSRWQDGVRGCDARKSCLRSTTRCLQLPCGQHTAISNIHAFHACMPLHDVVCTHARAVGADHGSSVAAQVLGRPELPLLAAVLAADGATTVEVRRLSEWYCERVVLPAQPLDPGKSKKVNENCYQNKAGSRTLCCSCAGMQEDYLLATVAPRSPRRCQPFGRRGFRRWWLVETSAALAQNLQALRTHAHYIRLRKNALLLCLWLHTRMHQRMQWRSSGAPASNWIRWWPRAERELSFDGRE
jgi:hypothetical protein